MKYLAPERLKGKHDHRCDIYGLAATLYELILRRPLFQSIDRAHLIELVSHSDPERPGRLDRRIPRDLETIILKGLNKFPERRYQSAQAMADDLRMFLMHRPIQARRVTWLEQVRMWCRRNTVAAGLAVILSIVMTILLATFLVNRALTIQRDVANKDRNSAVELLDRTKKAEQESAVRAIVNDIAAYRMSLEPELTPMLERLKEISVMDLPDDLRLHVRNELSSCLFRDDWYTTVLSVPRPAIDATYNQRRHVIASLTSDTELELSDSRTGNRLAITKLSAPYRLVRFSPDGDYLLLWAENNEHSIYRAHDLSEVERSRRLALGCLVSDNSRRMLFWHEGIITVESMERDADQTLVLSHVIPSGILSLDFSRDGRRIAYHDGTQVVVFDVDKSAIVGQFPMSSSGSLAFSPDGRWLACTDVEGILQVRDAKTLELRSELPPLNTVVSKLCWDHDSQLLALQTWGRMTLVVNPWTRRTLVRSRIGLEGVNFVFDQAHLGSQFADGKLEVLHWRPSLARDISPGPMRLGEGLIQIDVHPHLPILVGRTQFRVLLFEYPSGKLLWECREFRPLACRFSADGARLMLLDYHLIQDWQIHSNPLTGNVSFVAGESTPHQLTQQGPLLAIGASYIQNDLKTAVSMTSTGEIAELNLVSGLITRTLLSSPDSDVHPLGDGRLCGLCNWHQNQITILDTLTGNVVGLLDTGPFARVFADGKPETIATTNEKFIEFWTAEPLARTGKRLPHPVQHGQVIWHPNGQQVVTQTESSALEIRSAKTQDTICQLQADPEVVLTRLNFSSAGNCLLGTAQGSGTIRVWQLTELQHCLRQWQLDWDLDDHRESHGDRTVDQAGRADLVWQYDWTAAQPNSDRRWSLVIDEARATVARDPSDASINQLAWKLLLANRSSADAQEAKSMMQPLVARLPNNASFQNTMGLALYRTGEFNEAREMLLKNYQRRLGTPNSAFDSMVLALVYQKLEDSIQSRFYLERTDEVRRDSLDLSPVLKEQIDRLKYLAEHDSL